jgi:hypothetical protein
MTTGLDFVWREPTALLNEDSKVIRYSDFCLFLEGLPDVVLKNVLTLLGAFLRMIHKDHTVPQISITPVLFALI